MGLGDGLNQIICQRRRRRRTTTRIRSNHWLTASFNCFVFFFLFLFLLMFCFKISRCGLTSPCCMITNLELRAKHGPSEARVVNKTTIIGRIWRGYLKLAQQVSWTCKLVLHQKAAEDNKNSIYETAITERISEAYMKELDVKITRGDV